jgi:hypothetical protein
VIWLAARLVVGGGRENVMRLALMAIGLAAATVMLLCAAVAFPALQNHDERRGWMDTSAHNREPAQDGNTTDPLLWRLSETRFDGRTVIRVDVAAEGPDAPVPPGLEALPGDDELAVSPALRDLLERTDPAMLAERFPGEITGTVGVDALVAPDDLVVFVGHAAHELRDEPPVLLVRSIEAAPFTRTLTRVMRLAVAVGGVGLLAPLVVFVITATRLGAARRERRLAAMRLAGATPLQVSVIAAVEAAVGATVGVVLGVATFFAVRPRLASIPFDGSRFFASDLQLSWAWAAAVIIGIPVLAAATAVVSLRRVTVDPLGVAREAVPPRYSWRPLLLVGGGTAALAWTQASMTGASDVAVASAVAAAMLAIIVGIVLAGPWLTSWVARGLARLSRGVPSLLAARRLQANPAAGFRAIGGLILAVFVGTVFSTFTTSVLADEPGTQDDGFEPGVVTAALRPMPQMLQPTPVGSRSPAPDQVVPVVWPELSDDDAQRIVATLDAVPGGQHVATAHALPEDLFTRLIRSEGGLTTDQVGAMTCDDAALIGLDVCAGTTAVAIDGGNLRATGIDVTDVLPVDALRARPVAAFAAATDGTTSAIEHSRTRLEQALPASVAMTQADIDAKNESTARTTQHISTIALAVTVVIAGCSLSVAVASSIIERRRPFALLRLAGTHLRVLHRTVLAEAAAPLLVVALATAGLGMAVTAVTLASDTNSPPFTPPGPTYWLALGGSLTVALAIVAAALPLVGRTTAPDNVRFE